MKLSAAIFAVFPLTAIAQQCGPDGGAFMIAGSTTVEPISEKWKTALEGKCDVTITVESGGSSAGASRVCAEEGKGTPVQIGNMSREWKSTEGTVQTDGYTYKCVVGDATRSVIQIPVALDGLSVVAKLDGAAAKCINKLGGLTVDQLRWIFSSYTSTQLQGSGWSAASVPNSDGDDSTHLWSELKIDTDCPASEILIAGPDNTHGTYEYFMETVLKDYKNGETFRTAYSTMVDQAAAKDYVNANVVAIAYMGYSFYSQNAATLYVAAINGVKPTATTVADGSYTPLARRIYKNVLNDVSTLPHTKAYIQYGFTNAGAADVTAAGYVPIPESEWSSILKRLGIQSGGSSGRCGLLRRLFCRLFGLFCCNK